MSKLDPLPIEDGGARTTMDAIHRTAAKLQNNWLMQLAGALLGACYVFDPRLVKSLSEVTAFKGTSEEFLVLFLPAVLLYLFVHYGFLADNYLHLRAILDHELGETTKWTTKRNIAWRKMVDPSLFEFMYRISRVQRDWYSTIFGVMFVSFNLVIVGLGNAVVLAFSMFLLPFSPSLRTPIVALTICILCVCYYGIFKGNKALVVRIAIVVQALACLAFTLLLSNAIKPFY